jgi:hypothetical protein
LFLEDWFVVLLFSYFLNIYSVGGYLSCSPKKNPRYTPQKSAVFPLPLLPANSDASYGSSATSSKASPEHGVQTLAG